VDRLTRCRDMAVRNFTKCKVGRSAGRSVGRSSILYIVLIHSSPLRGVKIKVTAKWCEISIAYAGIYNEGNSSLGYISFLLLLLSYSSTPSYLLTFLLWGHTIIQLWFWESYSAVQAASGEVKLKRVNWNCRTWKWQPRKTRKWKCKTWKMTN